MRYSSDRMSSDRELGPLALGFAVLAALAHGRRHDRESDDDEGDRVKGVNRPMSGVSDREDHRYQYYGRLSASGSRHAAALAAIAVLAFGACGSDGRSFS